VEKSDLRWDEEIGQQIRLKRSLHPGTRSFVSLLLPHLAERGSSKVDTLLESQLFGHRRGSFTRATDTRPGLYKYAHGGTVFLDGIVRGDESEAASSDTKPGNSAGGFVEGPASIRAADRLDKP